MMDSRLRIQIENLATLRRRLSLRLAGISNRVVQTLDDPLEKGIDGVFEKGGKYFVVEYKYNTSQLNGKTADGIQMSDDWVENRLEAAVGSSALSKTIIKSGYTKLLCNILPDGTKTWQKLNSLATGPYKPNIEI